VGKCEMLAEKDGNRQTKCKAMRGNSTSQASLFVSHGAMSHACGRRSREATYKPKPLTPEQQAEADKLVAMLRR